MAICCSFPKPCPTLCDPMDCSTPGFPSFTLSSSLLKLMSTESVMPSNHLILCQPFSFCLQSFPVSIFSSELACHLSWPKYGNFGFSISPSNEYSGFISFRIDWFDSLLSKRVSRVFSSTTVQKHQFFAAQPSFWSNSHILHGYWKNYSFDYMALCQQSDVFAF